MLLYSLYYVSVGGVLVGLLFGCSSMVARNLDGRCCKAGLHMYHQHGRSFVSNLSRYQDHSIQWINEMKVLGVIKG
jgi:uncharacterized protein with NAD-binding domain and iron-sulfur cluster